MIGWFILACEIGFWVFVIAGLVARYIFKQKKLSTFLLLCTPVIDLFLIIATIVDLKNGATATLFHGVAAYYIGMTIAFGKRMIKWTDVRFAYKFADGPKPPEKIKHGREHAKRERQGWYRHALGWVVGNIMLLSMILFVGDKERTEELFNVVSLWALILAVDFVVSFSYTLFPRKGSIHVKG